MSKIAPVPSSSSASQPSHSRAERVWQIFVGFVLIIAGSGICYACFVFHSRSVEDFWQIGVVLAVEAYSLVGGLFILLGLRYIFGPRSWLRRRIGNSLRHLFIAAILILIITIAAYFFVLLAHANVA